MIGAQFYIASIKYTILKERGLNHHKLTSISYLDLNTTIIMLSKMPKDFINIRIINRESFRVMVTTIL